MANQECNTITKEYPASGGVLIIENITNGSKRKSDVIREILCNTACLGQFNLIQFNSRNTVDCGSHAKEAGI